MSAEAVPTPRYSQILGLGVHRPRRVVGNAEIAARTGLSEEWIVRRSGVRSRRFAGPDEPLTKMAAEASRAALRHAGMEAARIDAVLVATVSHLRTMPSLACEVAAEIGAGQAGALDLGAACAGFCYALALADDMVRAGSADHVLVIGAERYSDIIDHSDPATAFLFADGAGAAVVGPSSVRRIGPVAWGSDGSRAEVVGMSGYFTRDLHGRTDLSWPVFQMTGWRVYRWTTEEMLPAARRALKLASVTADDLDAFVPHQANRLIIEELARQLELPERTAVGLDIADSGNTSAASIPLALDALITSGRIGSGSRALLLGFGSGLTYAGQVVILP